MRKIVASGNLTKEQIEKSVNEIIKPLKDNSLPIIVVEQNGTKHKKLTHKEIEISCSSVYENLK